MSWQKEVMVDKFDDPDIINFRLEFEIFLNFVQAEMCNVNYILLCVDALSRIFEGINQPGTGLHNRTLYYRQRSNPRFE